MAKEEKKIVEKEKVKVDHSKKNFVHAVGRRREAVARIRLYHEPKEPVIWGEEKIEKGQIFVNGKPIALYFAGSVTKAAYEEPLRATNMLEKSIVTIIVAGGGKNGQLDAVIHGISRALSKLDTEKHRKTLKKKGFLTRDPRTRERRKVGMGGKARRKRQSPKR